MTNSCQQPYFTYGKMVRKGYMNCSKQEYISGGVGLESSSPDTPTSVLLIDNILPIHQSYDVGIFLI